MSRRKKAGIEYFSGSRRFAIKFPAIPGSDTFLPERLGSGSLGKGKYSDTCYYQKERNKSFHTINIGNGS